MAKDQAIQHRNREVQPTETTDRPTRGHINTIQESAIGKESNNAKKAYALDVYNLYKQPSKKFRAIRRSPSRMRTTSG